MKKLILIFLLTSSVSALEFSLYGVGGEISAPDGIDLANTKGYYGLGGQILSFQKYLGNFAQLNFGYVHKSVWYEIQAGVFAGKNIFIVHPRIGLGVSYMSINDKRYTPDYEIKYSRKHNADGFIKFQGTIFKKIFLEWEGKFNTYPNWNMKIGYSHEI